MSKLGLFALGVLVALGVNGRPALTDLANLPSARITADPRKGELVIELAPVDLPAGASHHVLAQPPVAVLEMPTGGAIYGFRIEVVDSAGRAVPGEVLHHFNFIDLEHRELFLPISRRILAAGGETQPARLPWFLFGLPLRQGQRVLANAMVHNPTAASYRQVRVRLVLLYTPEGRPWPLFKALPWQLDVAFPVGDKSFDLAPGRSTRSYEGRPAVPGKVVALGGHLHQYGERIEFADATTGEVIYQARPVTDSAGHIVSVPVGRLYGWTRLGARIVPAHTYRVTVYYDNPTGRVLPAGGMGVVGGLFVPDRGATWPAADTTDALYQQDLRHAMRLGGRGSGGTGGGAAAAQTVHQHGPH